MKTFTSLIASIVDSLVVNPWILKRCLLIENPRLGSAFLWQRMSTQLARAASVGNFFFPSSSIIYLTYRVNIYGTISPNVALKGSLPECTAFVIVKQFFLWKSLLLCGSRLLKKHIFSGLRSRYRRQANRKKLILPLKITSKLRRTWPLALAIHNFLSQFHFFKVGEICNVVEIWEFDVTSRTYSRPKLRSTVERCPLLRKLYKTLFRCKTLREGIE